MKEVCKECRYYTGNKKHDHYRCRIGECPALPITTTLNRPEVMVLVRSLPIPYGGNEYTKFTGNQWNESWAWDNKMFEGVTTVGLMEFYNRILRENILKE